MTVPVTGQVACVTTVSDETEEIACLPLRETRTLEGWTRACADVATGAANGRDLARLGNGAW